MAQTTTIDSQGRIVIPKKLRDKKGLKGEVEIVEAADGILIRRKKGIKANWDAVFSKKLVVKPNKIGKAIASESYDSLWL